jgi:hypothetical protein
LECKKYVRTTTAETLLKIANWEIYEKHDLIERDG